MPRAIWSGSISFGLVNIPVKLFSAVSHKDVRFHQLHDADGARIKEKRVCSVDGKEVPYEHIVKGYEVSPGRYVAISPEELEALDPKATRTIDIESFVDVAEIDPIYYDQTYYLAPDKGAAKAYGLLLGAMKSTEKVGIAQVVLRTKQRLCAVRPIGQALSMSVMIYNDEIVPTSKLDDLPSSEIKPRDQELKMAQQLIGSLSARFEPKKYKDEYRQKVLELIDRKQKGEKIAAPPQRRESAKVVNLLEALKASLEGGRRGPRPTPKGRVRTGPERSSAPAETRRRKGA
ncbi:MAG TPA: Ku protein [Myxococcales bacterium]